MARSDYKLIQVQQNFTQSNPTFTTNFDIEGNPINNFVDAYLLVQVRGVADSRHRISINNRSLPDFDLPPAPGNSQSWLLWMDHIPTDFLRSGNNSITITRGANDNFEVNNVVVNWREL